MFPDLSTFLTPSNIFFMLFITVGSVIVYRGSRGKGLSELQEKTIATLQVQIGILEKKVVHLNRVVMTIEYALKRRGLRIEIDDEFITLIDERSRSNPVQIRMMEAMSGTDDDKGA